MPSHTAKPTALLLALALIASSCSTMSSMQQGIEDNPKAVLGSLLGAAAGAGIAAAAGGGAGAIVGAGLGGALIGGFIGNRLDNRDKRLATEAAQRAFENNHTGQTSVWQNPDSGHSGTITPTRTYQIANGQYCREYQQTVVIGGEQHQAYGTACRQPDGTWRMQQS